MTSSALAVSFASIILSVDSLSLNRFRTGDLPGGGSFLSIGGLSAFVGVSGRSASMTISSTMSASCCVSVRSRGMSDLMFLLSSRSRLSLSTAIRSFPTTAVYVMKKTVKVVTSAVSGLSWWRGER